MPSPSTAITSPMPELAGCFEEFDLEMDRQGFIGHRVLPVLEVAEASGKFGKITIESLLQSRNTNRAPGAGYNRGDFKFTTDSYACEEEGFEMPIDDRQAKMYRHFFDAQSQCARRAYDAVLREAEKRIAAAVFNATTWTSYTTSAGTEWSTVASATPMANVETAVLAVFARTGIWPNALIMNRKVFRNLRRTAEIIDKVKAQNFMDVRAGNINAAILAQCFDLEHVIVAGAAKNTANEGQDASLSPIWSDEYAMVCRIASSDDIQEPCIGRTMHWGEDGSDVGGTVETYRDEVVRADIIRVRHDVDEKILYAATGQLIDNVTA